jgi:hypothetical protein
VTSSTPRTELDAARALVAQRDLTGAAVGALSETVRKLPMEALGPVKQLLKRFFSDQPWDESDDAKLAQLFGTGSGAASTSEHLALDPELTLVWGWEHGRFTLRVTRDQETARPSDDTAPATTADDDLGLTFETEVFPEVTPSPRTIRFGTPPLHSGASRFYNSGTEAAEDPRAARLFADFDAVTNVLVGPDFVAVTIARPDQWQALLGPVLTTVAEEFTGSAPASARAVDPPEAAVPNAGTDPTRPPRQLERAWAELGSLRAERADDLERILAAAHDAEPARRQVAAALLSDAPPPVADEAWERLSGDERRTVRRSVVDAAVDAGRETLRPLLERALSDPDAWIRWKAMHGLGTLGATESRAAIEARVNDPDFRVRLEAARVLGSAKSAHGAEQTHSAEEE